MWFDTVGGGSRKQLTVNAYNPVALFDSAYDDLGIAPRRNGAYPSVAAGAWVTRRLVLYNQEWRDTIVTERVSIRSADNLTEYASGTYTVRLDLGGQVMLTARFQVPYGTGGRMAMVLATEKSGQKRFEESNYFTVSGTGSGSTSAAVELTGGVPVGVAAGSRTVGVMARSAGRWLAVFDIRGRFLGVSARLPAAGCYVVPGGIRVCVQGERVRLLQPVR
jgi:hypothetical protein